MIAYLQGSIIESSIDTLVLNVNGVGYEVHCSATTLSDVAGEELVKLWIHTHVREDQFQLFGFSHQTEKKLFLSLNSISGIGPKMALKILSGTTIENLVQMIEEGDVKALTALPKIGKKTAEQIILSLKGQLVLDEGSASAVKFAARADIVSALVNLGFRSNEVEAVVAVMPRNMDVQQGIREGLAKLTAPL
ncbi:MAG: Holliday junction branch migration protein RuvA [Pseudobdellovibrionaceae bacterium]|nr:Holliday junction branch migration protein RuvA [Bdellovibrionales bacterium]USN48777.1 MAG: Holliday junction branch migration protein RuvA [Pseudobdellovibrionaceae bacterium]